MANEITASLSFSVTNPSDGSGFASSNRLTRQYNQNAIGVNAEILAVPVTATAYSFASITTNGFLLIQNLDTTNFVDYGLNASGFLPFGRLKPGEFALLRLTPGIAFMAKADTATVNVSYQLFND